MIGWWWPIDMVHQVHKIKENKNNKDFFFLPCSCHHSYCLIQTICGYIAWWVMNASLVNWCCTETKVGVDFNDHFMHHCDSSSSSLSLSRPNGASGFHPPTPSYKHSPIQHPYDSQKDERAFIEGVCLAAPRRVDQIIASFHMEYGGGGRKSMSFSNVAPNQMVPKKRWRVFVRSFDRSISELTISLPFADSLPCVVPHDNLQQITSRGLPVWPSWRWSWCHFN